MPVFNDPQSRSYARLTGAFYLTIAVAGGFAIGYVPAELIDMGDMASTLQAIDTRRGLFNLGIAGDSLVLLVEIMTTTMLFFMFRPVNATLAAAAALARFAMVGVMAAMLLFHAGLLTLVDGASAFPPEQTQALAGLLLHMHHAGVWVWQLFFALHLAILGQLVARSGRFPVLLGHAMTLGSAGYLLDSIHAFAAPDAALLGAVRIGLLVIVTLAEVGFALWLLTRGPRPMAMPAFA